jgi:CRP-like cAMP-binding protein
MTNIFIQKLRRGVELSESDQRLLADATSCTEIIPPNTHLIREGDLQDGAYVLLSGLAYCFKLLSSGERQIVACRVPGDADGFYGIANESADYTVVTLTPCSVAFISRDTIDSQIAQSLNINRALWWSLLVEKSYLCASLLNVGQRPAPQRLAYLICELLSRLRAVGSAQAGGFDIPLTYQDYADMLGMSVVHTYRAFKQLRNHGVFFHNGKGIVVTNAEYLNCFADFALTCVE